MSGTEDGTAEIDAEIDAAPSGRPATLQLRVPARPSAVPELRHRTGAWLAALAWPPDEFDDLHLAIAEACTNAVEHAYGGGPPGEVMVTAHVEARGGLRRVVVVVQDWGRWRPAPDDPGFRGHGLAVMRACAAEMRVDRDRSGTTVTLVSAAVPGLAAADGRPAAGTASALRRRPAGVAVRTLDTAGRRDRRAAVHRRSGDLRTAAERAVERAVAAHRRARELASATTTCTADARGICAAGARRRAS